MFRIVDEVVNEAYNEDKEYVRHLEETIAERVAPVDVYDFAYEIIVDDEAKVTIPNIALKRPKRLLKIILDC